jgi:MFS superfamily sulfate permease-like transporter
MYPTSNLTLITWVLAAGVVSIITGVVCALVLALLLSLRKKRSKV